jgi:hypothetical protein
METLLQRRARWHEDAIQNQQPLVPLDFGLGVHWLGAEWAGFVHVPPAHGEAAGAACLPGLGTQVARWPGRCAVSAVDTRVHCSAAFVAGLGPAAWGVRSAPAEAWLHGLGEFHAGEAGPARTCLSHATRATSSAGRVPPGQRLALVLGLTEFRGELPRPLPLDPPAGSDAVEAALGQHCAVLDTEHGATLAELLVHVRGEVDSRITVKPDHVVAPLGTRGSADARVFARRCCFVNALSADGRSASVDSVAATLQLLATAALFVLSREARAREWEAAGQAGLDLRQPVLAVGMPAGWKTRSVHEPRIKRNLLARVWRFTWRPGPGPGCIDVERSPKLTLGEAATLIAQHSSSA